MEKIILLLNDEREYQQPIFPILLEMVSGFTTEEVKREAGRILDEILPFTGDFSYAGWFNLRGSDAGYDTEEEFVRSFIEGAISEIRIAFLNHLQNSDYYYSKEAAIEGLKSIAHDLGYPVDITPYEMWEEQLEILITDNDIRTAGVKVRDGEYIDVYLA